MNKCIRKTNEQFVSGLRKVRLLETMSYIVLLAMVVGEAVIGATFIAPYDLRLVNDPIGGLMINPDYNPAMVGIIGSITVAVMFVTVVYGILLLDNCGKSD